jgi:hypothetical protein
MVGVNRQSGGKVLDRRAMGSSDYTGCECRDARGPDGLDVSLGWEWVMRVGTALKRGWAYLLDM